MTSHVQLDCLFFHMTHVRNYLGNSARHYFRGIHGRPQGGEERGTCSTLDFENLENLCIFFSKKTVNFFISYSPCKMCLPLEIVCGRTWWYSILRFQ